MSRSLDGSLAWHESVLMHLHGAVCSRCGEYFQQIKLIHTAVYKECSELGPACSTGSDAMRGETKLKLKEQITARLH